MSNAATVMVILMLPAFMFAMYEKDGMHLEDMILHILNVKVFRPPIRTYESENYYESNPETTGSKNASREKKGGKTGVKKKK